MAVTDHAFRLTKAPTPTMGQMPDRCRKLFFQRLLASHSSTRTPTSFAGRIELRGGKVGQSSICYYRSMLDATLLLPERPRPLRREEYDRLVALGAFEDERIELLHGVLVDMSPNDPRHVSPIDRLTMTLAPALRGRAIVRIQSPLVAADDSEPETDVAVVPIEDYRTRHPSSAHLVVEVAVSSLNKDRKVKAPLYAASGVSEYWIVNVPERAVEVYRQPAHGAYAAVTLHRESEVLSPLAFPDVAVAVADLFS